MKFLVCLLVFSAVFVSSNSFATREIPIRSERSVRQQFDSYLELFRKELTMTKEKDKKNRFSLLSQVVNEMKSLRQELGASDSEDAKHMDMTIASLKELPSKKEFKRKNCKQYRANISDDSPLAQDFLSSVCN